MTETPQNCAYAGRSGPLKTFCRHPQLARERRSVPVLNSRCTSCVLRSDHNTHLQRCIHQLAVVELVNCKACGGGTVQWPVHSCALHGECQPDPYAWEKLKENGRSVHCCRHCTDHTQH